MKLIAALFLIVFFSLSNSAPTSAGMPSSILISEFQTGSEILGTRPADCTEAEYDAGKLEFVELYNPSETAVDLNGHKLEFITESGSTTRNFANLQGIVAAKSYFLISYKCYLQDKADLFFNGTTQKDVFPKTTGGYLRLVDSNASVTDLVSWGKAKPESTWWHEPKPIAHDNSINRIFLNNSFSAQTQPTPGEAFNDNLPQPQEPENPEEPPEIEQPSHEPTEICEDVVLSEILPNPSGDDVDNEFIEIMNPTEKTIYLKGCLLKLENSTKQFALPNIELLPGQFKAFFSIETKLTLTNSTATTVWLVTQNSEQGVKYKDGLDSGSSWAFINGEWWQTTTATPNEPNILTEKEVILVSTPICEPGKELNPATNRCRLMATLHPIVCQAGQERNPQTNRCRSMASASNEPKPCPEGQERNPDTNRCRKVLAANTTNLPAVQDIPSAPKQDKWPVWIILALISAAVGYAIYEWRPSIIRQVAKIKQKEK